MIGHCWHSSDQLHRRVRTTDFPVLIVRAATELQWDCRCGTGPQFWIRCAGRILKPVPQVLNVSLLFIKYLAFQFNLVCGKLFLTKVTEFVYLFGMLMATVVAPSLINRQETGFSKRKLRYYTIRYFQVRTSLHHSLRSNMRHFGQRRHGGVGGVWGVARVQVRRRLQLFAFGLQRLRLMWESPSFSSDDRFDLIKLRYRYGRGEPREEGDLHLPVRKFLVRRSRDPTVRGLPSARLGGIPNGAGRPCRGDPDYVQERSACLNPLVFLVNFSSGNFSFFRWIPESPRWLLERGKFCRAKELLERAAKVNGKDVSETQVEGYGDLRWLLTVLFKHRSGVNWVTVLQSRGIYMGGGAQVLRGEVCLAARVLGSHPQRLLRVSRELEWARKRN